MTEKYTVTPQGGNEYLVTIDFVGSFHGFADPTNGTALNSSGSDKEDHLLHRQLVQRA